MGSAENYRLTVSGIVSYSPEDFSIRDVLMQEGDDRARLAEALQELEEEAANVKITMEKLS